VDPTERLLAIEDLQQLKARYFRLLDTKQWDAWGEVFSTDCVMEVPDAGMAANGRADIVASVSALLDGTQTAHHGHMPELELTGPDTARGTWAMFDYVEWPATEDGRRVGLMGYGHYHDEYVREDGTWRIARTRLERLRTDPLS
jgi:SnoaL-like protein